MSISLFAATMDSKVRSVPKDTMETVFKKPKEGLPLVVKYLTQNAGGAQAKVKVMHDWICDNIAYDTDMYFSGRVSKQDYESVLKKKKGVCSGYTSVMNEMCRLAGIESIGIHGYSKGFGYQGKLGNKPDHEWNAVNINGKWQLVDVTWDAGFVDYKTFVKRYSTEWLNRTPEQFIFSHLPEKDEYQYLKQIKTKEEFVKEPYVAGKFFDYGLSFDKAMPDYTNEISESVKYEFKLSKNTVSVMSDLSDKNGQTGIIQNATWIDRVGSKIIADYDVPTANLYRGRILARNRNETKNPPFFSIAEFEGRILPQAQQLIAEKKITQKEYDYLENSYFKVNENQRYYLAEDLFDNPRNLAVTKILKLEVKNSQYEEVLYFDLKAADGYAGFGNGVMRFPTAHRTYDETTNTHIISPVAGILQKGSTQKFGVTSKDFSAIGIVIDGKIVPLKKDAKTGTFELEATVPENVDELLVYGSKNGKNYNSLWAYKVE